MKILVAAFAFNERPYIPYMAEYYRSQGCDLLILDNYSTDGTYEWLVENNVSTGRVNTNESFYLGKLQNALLLELRKIKPDWIVYTGIDAYYFFSGTICEEIEKAESLGCDIVEVSHIEVHSTGEEMKLPFPSNFFYIVQGFRKLHMISKFGSGIRFLGDSILKSGVSKIYHSNGFFINYGMCKPKQEREVTYQRRRKAWLMGELKGHGTHYQSAQKREWQWTKSELVDIRLTEWYKMMVK